MPFTYKDVVFNPIGGSYELVWCEYRARLHTAVELRYKVSVFEATLEFAPEQIYRKGHHLFDSSWKKTPKKAREDVEDEVGKLEKDNIRYEKWFGAPYEIPIISNDF